MTTTARTDQPVGGDGRLGADPTAQVAEFQRFIELIQPPEPDRVFEVRAIDVPPRTGRGKPHVAAGFFRSLEAAAAAQQRLARLGVRVHYGRPRPRKVVGHGG